MRKIQIYGVPEYFPKKHADRWCSVTHIMCKCIGLFKKTSFIEGKLTRNKIHQFMY